MSETKAFRTFSGHSDIQLYIKVPKFDNLIQRTRTGYGKFRTFWGSSMGWGGTIPSGPTPDYKPPALTIRCLLPSYNKTKPQLCNLLQPQLHCLMRESIYEGVYKLTITTGLLAFTYSYLSILYTKKQTMHQIGVVQIKCQLYWALLAFINIHRQKMLKNCCYDFIFLK